MLPECPRRQNIKSLCQTGGSRGEKYVDLWLQVRPVKQVALSDERTGEKVRYLFQFRGRQVGRAILNNTLIPILCARGDGTSQRTAGHNIA
ncbi:hypothetical protein SME06J_35000 [Serratia marcescens]|nr:hypothetical protein SME06J_35000 [Serratia marcescens]